MVSGIQTVRSIEESSFIEMIVFFRFLESVHEIELIIVKLINEAMAKAVTIEQMVDVLEIFTDFQQRTVRMIR